jgi:hypothetical protein
MLKCIKEVNSSCSELLAKVHVVDRFVTQLIWNGIIADGQHEHEAFLVLPDGF